MKFEEIKNIILTDTFINEAYYFDSVNSTNDFLKSTHELDNVLAVAGYQTHGRGRLNHKWESEPDKNLIFSIKKKLDMKYKSLFTVNFYFSYLLLKSIEDFLKSESPNVDTEKFSIKWPNDLLFDNKNFSGILMENNLIKKEYIIGIGVNVNQDKFLDEYNANTTSLSIISRRIIDTWKLLVQILKCFSENIELLSLEKSSQIYKLWKSKCKIIGKTVDFIQPNKEIQSAQVIDINDDGSIKLKVNNKISDFYSGELKLVTN